MGPWWYVHTYHSVCTVPYLPGHFDTGVVEPILVYQLSNIVVDRSGVEVLNNLVEHLR